MTELESLYSEFTINSFYPDYIDLLNCFNLDANKHIGTGSELVYYKDDYAYPYEIDNGKFLRFLLNKLSEYQFMTDVEFEKAWWVDYPVHAYAGFHCHKHHKDKQQFTTVLFLTTSEENEVNPFEGYLYLLNNEKYNEYKPVAGNFHTFNGSTWHGTYPSVQDRKVFVCDVSFNYVF